MPSELGYVREAPYHPSAQRLFLSVERTSGVTCRAGVTRPRLLTVPSTPATTNHFPPDTLCVHVRVYDSNSSWRAARATSVGIMCGVPQRGCRAVLECAAGTRATRSRSLGVHAVTVSAHASCTAPSATTRLPEPFGERRTRSAFPSIPPMCSSRADAVRGVTLHPGRRECAHPATLCASDWNMPYSLASARPGCFAGESRPRRSTTRGGSTEKRDSRPLSRAVCGPLGPRAQDRNQTPTTSARCAPRDLAG